MLLVEFFSLLLSEFGHFDITNGESIFLNDIDDFSCIHIAIWFNHGKGFSLLGLEFRFGELVSIIYYFELSGVDIENGADEDIFELESLILGSSEEHFAIFEIEHFDGFILREVC